MATKLLSTTFEPSKAERPWYEEWVQRGYFRALADPARRPWSVMMPLPNVTGELHIGHALNNTLQDLLTRFRRMQRYNALYQPGTDHAGIATQNVVERELAKEGVQREDLGREGFQERVWAWVRKYGSIIYAQLERLGVSCDWDRKAFTLDPAYYDAVLEAFIRLYNRGLIYRGKDMVNWCPRCRTSISDLEVVHEEIESFLWYVRYPGADGSPGLVIATQRPETILADVAVAVHPADDRYRALIGREVIVPLVQRRVPVIADARVDPDFGTGALKITPGHDPLDYEIGRDHQLPTIVILDEDARMTRDAGEFAGLDRFEARERVAEAITAQGLLEKVEPYRASVGRCDRCHTIIEPYISDQWFCEMKELPQRAAAALRAGQVRFYPERWQRITLEWLEKIRPWTISRQLWWGHRIPVWQCEACGERTAAKTAPQTCKACGGAVLHQDPDVLDTWFSSALWPFATLGWPKQTADQAYFYPTSVLVTDRSIIFLWVARMIMFGLEFMGKVPFRDVYINPTVLDMQGRRMSKSLGTGVDPLDAIEKYGADALRFGLVLRCSQAQQDLRFDEKMVEDVRNFDTKIWNATRFVLMNLDGFDASAPSPPPAVLSVADRWIRSRYTHLTQTVTAALEAYELDKAARALYDFLWGEYCDWYLEMAKVDLYRSPEGRDRAPTVGQRSAVQYTLWSILSNTMHLLHPIMPFVTEEVWQHLPHTGPSIMVSPWPTPEEAWIDPRAEAEMGTIMAVVRALRSLRAELAIPAAQVVPMQLHAGEPERNTLERATAYIAALGKSTPITIESFAAPRPPHSVATVLPNVEMLVPLGGILDIAKERERLGRAVRALEADLERLRRKLDNREFLDRAPAEVVERERTRSRALHARRRRLQEFLEALSAPG